jgi:uncharacterized protein (TIRG00374 family)
MAKKITFWLGLIVTVVCLYFVFRGIDFGKLANIVKGINIPLLLVAVGLYLCGYYLRAVRWHFLLKHIKDFKAQELFPYLVIGFMANNILPARAGEFIRAYLTGRSKGISKSSAFASIVIERVFDGLVMIFFFVLGYLAFHYVNRQVMDPISIHMFGRTLGIRDAVTLFAAAGSLVFLGIFTVSVLLINKKEATVKFLHGIFSKIHGKAGEAFNKIIDTFIEGLGVLRSKSSLFWAFFYSFLAWSIEAFTYYLMAVAMGIQINFLLVCLIMAVANFAIMAPSTSGGVGPFEFFGVGTMLLFAYSKEEATAFIIMIHAMILLPIIILGLIFMFAEGLDLGKLVKEKEESQNAH